MGLEPKHLAAAIAAALASTAMSTMGQIALWFGVPPPTPREIGRGLADMVGGVFVAVMLGYAFGHAAAQLLTAAFGALPFLHARVDIDDLAGGVAVGSTAQRLLPAVLNLLESRIRKLSGGDDHG